MRIFRAFAIRGPGGIRRPGSIVLAGLPPTKAPRVLTEEENMAFYEHVLIARPEISPQQVDALVEDLTKTIRELGGTTTKTEYWGLRNLTYRIQKNRKGHYVFLGLDCAASEFCKDGKYILEAEAQKEKSPDQLIEYYESLIGKYPLITIEDGLDENDWAGWSKLTQKLGKKVQLVGDDLLVTNTEKLSRAIREGIANSILVKVNQIGTLTETINAVTLAQHNGYNTIMSHRSGETEDVTIADIARRADVAVGSIYARFADKQAHPRPAPIELP